MERSRTIPANPPRRHLPRTRSGGTTSFQVAGTEFFVTANGHPDGTLGEVFAKFGKEGSTTAGLMDLLSIAISLGLQHGVPPQTYVEKFKAMRFEPMGPTDDPDIPEVSSIGDYLARRIALDWLPLHTRKPLGILTPAEQATLPHATYAPTPLIRRPAMIDAASRTA